jgi:monoamine oxidase
LIKNKLPYINIIFEQAQLKLYLAASAFSESEAGYMQGAIVAASREVEKILLTVE